MPASGFEDVSEFFDFDEFAVEATITRDDGVRIPVAGIFDEPYLNAELGEYELDTSAPRLVVDERQVADVRRGDKVLIGSVIYDIMTAPQSDGAGLATLRLARRHATV